MPETSSEQEPDDSDAEFVEVDPTRRYGRYKEVLGKGAFKKVYKAFDELEGIEVAWNQVKVADLLRNSEDLERIYSEVHLLKTLKHKNIIKFYNSWVDTKNEHINFITEIFTSGTLRQYRKKHKRVDVRALKKWSRQILEGLLYLHSHDPPIIHRDLKCDNIFVNGNHGELKIGDLGLAAILHHANAAHSVIGTPEFMAPELYEEEYNELVDIYAFGLCMLELVTFEYPYNECSNAAQIYKKVTSGIKPASLAKVPDPDVKTFIEKCIAKVSERLSARELLRDPFLSGTHHESIGQSLHVNLQHAEVAHTQSDIAREGLEHPGPSRDLTVHGERKDVNTVFVKLRITDSKGCYRNIHFPFDIEADTSIAVASEMVHELDLTDQDIPTISDMIDSEIRALIPDWSPRESSIGESVFDSLTSDSKDDVSSPLHVSENKDERSPLTNPSASLFPDQLPSGRIFWSDSPRPGTGLSPIKCSPGPMSPSKNLLSGTTEDFTFQCKDMPEIPGNSDFHEVRRITEKLELLLAEQQKELDELKWKHELAVNDILKDLPSETRLKVFNMCCRKIPDYKMHCQMNLCSGHVSSLDVSNVLGNNVSSGRILTRSSSTLDVSRSPTIFHVMTKIGKQGVGLGFDGACYRDKANSLKRVSKSDLGIAVILKDNSEES